MDAVNFGVGLFLMTVGLFFGVWIFFTLAYAAKRDRLSDTNLVIGIVILLCMIAAFSGGVALLLKGGGIL